MPDAGNDDQAFAAHAGHLRSRRARALMVALPVSAQMMGPAAAGGAGGYAWGPAYEQKRRLDGVAPGGAVALAHVALAAEPAVGIVGSSRGTVRLRPRRAVLPADGR